MKSKTRVWLTRLSSVAVLATLCVAVSATSGGAASGQQRETKGETLQLWGGGVLTSATPGSSARKWLDTQIARFKAANPGSNVEVSLLPNDLNALAAKVQAAFASGKTPDVMMLWSGNLTEPYAEGLQTLNKYIKATPGFYKSYSGWDLSCINYDCKNGAGKVIGVPVEAGGYFLFYNKELLRKAGISAPPKTYKQLFAACSALRKAGILPMAYGAKDGYEVSNTVTPNLVSTFSPGDVQKLLAGKLKYTNPKIVNALDSVLQLAPDKQNCVDADSYTTEALTATKSFLAGKAAMAPLYGVLLADMKKALGKNLGVARLPVSGNGPLLKKGSGYAANSFANWMIPKDAANPDLAWKFLKIATDKTASRGILTQLGETPSNKAIAASVKSPIDKYLAGLVGAPAIVNIDQVVPQSVAFYFYKQLELAFQGKQTALEAMKAVQKFADSKRKSG